MNLASPEDRQYKLEKDVRGTDFDIQTFEIQSTHEIVYIRYPWDEKRRAKCGKSERGNVSILITDREFLIPPKFSKVPRIERWRSFWVFKVPNMMSSRGRGAEAKDKVARITKKRTPHKCVTKTSNLEYCYCDERRTVKPWLAWRCGS